MRRFALCGALLLPGCLLLVDRPAGSDDAAASSGAPDDSDDDGSDTTCIDYIAEGLDVVAGTTVGAGDDIDGCGVGNDVVIAWVAPSTGVYTFSVHALFDSMLAIHRPSCGAAPIVCEDDCVDTNAAVEYFATRGEELFIVVDTHEVGS